MAIYRDGKLVGAGGSIAPTVFTDGVTLEGDGSKNNRVRVKNDGVISHGRLAKFIGVRWKHL